MLQDFTALFHSIDAVNPAKLRGIGPFNEGSKIENNISYSEKTVSLLNSCS